MLAQLRNLIPPPEKPCETGTPKAWEKIEAQLGLELPSDYKTLIDFYGSGSFADSIIVYNPFAQDEFFNLFFALDTLHQADQKTQMVGNPVWTAVHPFCLYPAEQGLLPWGCTTNMVNAFFWQIKGATDAWETVFYNLRDGEYEVWKHPLSEFIYRLFTRQIRSVLLPDGYPLAEMPMSFIPTHR